MEPSQPSARIELEPATLSDRTALENLMQLYAHDFSEMIPADVGEDGRFHGMSLASYWVDSWRHPLLIRVDSRLAGFALVSARSRISTEDGVDMAEFFVLRAFRRKGVGLAAASLAFDRFVGSWEVRQRVENTEATAFWRRTIDEYTQGQFEDLLWDDAHWVGPVQRFVSPGRSTMRRG